MNLTVADLKAEKRRKETARPGVTRESRRVRSRDYPTYDAVLRAYAPGSAVVGDGLSYRSAGVTLNGKLPPEVEVELHEAACHAR